MIIEKWNLEYKLLLIHKIKGDIGNFAKQQTKMILYIIFHFQRNL